LALLRHWNWLDAQLKGKPNKERHKQDFLAHIKDAFKEDLTVRPESIARPVFKVLARHTSQDEIDDVKEILPKALHELRHRVARLPTEPKFQTRNRNL
jgi:uncharacterized protein (DUF2267 family)